MLWFHDVRRLGAFADGSERRSSCARLLPQAMLQELRDLGMAETNSDDPEDSARFADALERVAKLRSEREEAVATLSRVDTFPEPASEDELLERLERSLAAVEEAATRAGEQGLAIIADAETTGKQNRKKAGDAADASSTK